MRHVCAYSVCLVYIYVSLFLVVFCLLPKRCSAVHLADFFWVTVRKGGFGS